MLNFFRRRESEKIVKEEKEPIEKKVGKVFVGTTAGELFPFAPWGEKKKLKKLCDIQEKPRCAINETKLLKNEKS